MTTSPSAAYAASPPVAARPSRQAQPARLRRASQVVLVLGSVLAAGAAFGPTWLVRIGVGIAVAAAVFGCVFAWREMFLARRKHARDMLEASQQHGHALREERTRNVEVVDTLTRRVGEAGQVVEGQRVVIAKLRSEVSGLHGDRAHLKAEVAHRDTVIGSLRETVRSREAELAVLQAETSADGDPAPVRHMPRRLLAEHESSWAELPNADELWSDGSHPTVVDLRMIDTAMVLPNCEVDRRVG